MTTLTQELIEQVKNLSPDDKGRLLEILHSDQTEEFRAELRRRIQSLERGEMPTYSTEETMAYLRQQLSQTQP